MVGSAAPTHTARVSIVEDDVGAGSRNASKESARRFARGGSPGNVPLYMSEDETGKRLNSHRYIKGTVVEKPPPTDGNALYQILLHPINIMLVFLPLGVASTFFEWGDVFTFWFNFFAMIPLAKMLGDATEELAASLKNDMIAGLMNATFGNAVEMVITIKTLRAELYDVVKATLLGSVLSNTLLVLGMSFLCGGIVAAHGSSDARTKLIYESVQQEELQRGDMQLGMPQSSTRLSASKGNEGAKTASTPTKDVPREADVPSESVAKETTDGKSTTVDLSEATADIFGVQSAFVGEKLQSFSTLGALVNTSMLLISCMSLSLITVFQTVRGDTEEHHYNETILLPVSRIASIIIMMAYAAYTFFQLVTHKQAMAVDQEEEEEDGADESRLSAAKATLLLFIVTIVVSLCTEQLVNAIKGVTKSAHMSKHFIGIVLLPIVGNACEHAAAVRFAMQDKMGLSVSIAVGSSTQIALFVVPFSVLIGWGYDLPMDLNFGVLSTSMITLSVIVVLSMVVDGQSNWLQGYLLMSVYAIIAVMYWYLPDDLNDSVN